MCRDVCKWLLLYLNFSMSLEEAFCFFKQSFCSFCQHATSKFFFWKCFSGTFMTLFITSSTLIIQVNATLRGGTTGFFNERETALTRNQRHCEAFEKSPRGSPAREIAGRFHTHSVPQSTWNFRSVSEDTKPDTYQNSASGKRRLLRGGGVILLRDRRY